MRAALMRQIKLILVILLGYLAHVTIMPYLRLGDVTPSLLIATTAIVAVGYGLLRGLWTGLFYGIVMEIMLPTVPMLNLLFYPITALLSSAIFSDRSAAQLQYAQSIGKRSRNRNPLLRTVFFALFNVFCYEAVNLVYMYLSGAALSAALIMRGLTDLFATTALTAVIMIPVRKFLGFRKKEEEQTPELRFDHRPERDAI